MNAGAGLGPRYAWYGRVSTEDEQDPTLSFPRQLANAEHQVAVDDDLLDVEHLDRGRTVDGGQGGEQPGGHAGPVGSADGQDGAGRGRRPGPRHAGCRVQRHRVIVPHRTAAPRPAPGRTGRPAGR